MRNPLYHWTHLELQRYFNINTLLNSQTATEIFNQTSAIIQQPNMAVQGLLKKMQVALVCTTDDPIDTLEYHQQMQQQQGLRMLPAFRPDKAMLIEDVVFFNNYLQQLSAVTNIDINNPTAYIAALVNRHNYFAANGCTVSDHGLEQLYIEPYTSRDIYIIFAKALQGVQPNLKEVHQFKNFALTEIAKLNCEKNWVQQFHLGALRNNNSRMLQQLGADTGWDSIGDFSQAKQISVFLNSLDSNNQLAKTIIYNLNPADNELMATMIGNFNDGSVAGKVQWGSAWWFLDQKDGMEKQLNALSNMGLVSKFVGMLTDSRSFLSFPRHEYFRRILCNLFGNEIENGELPNDIPWIGKLVQDICYNNAKEYFNF
jgi:glucuronate isomerase